MVTLGLVVAEFYEELAAEAHARIEKGARAVDAAVDLVEVLPETVK